MVDRTSAPQSWRESQRKRAFELKQQDWSQRQIAEALGVSEPSVGRWMAQWRERGDDAWRDKPRPGRPTKLTHEQMALVPELLLPGAEAWGFQGELWTCGRIRHVIEEAFGVTYHPAQV